MIVHEIIDYHANDFFFVLRQQVNYDIEDAFATKILGNIEEICLEPDTAVIKAG